MNAHLTDMKSAGLDVNWLTLLVGLRGPGKHAPVLTPSDIASFAVEIFESSPAGQEATVAVLVAMADSAEETHAVLRKLADRENLDAECELRKWRIVMLQRALSHLPSDPLDGLLSLTEFWEQFDYPPDSPHVVQGRGDDTTSPADYYTEKTFRDLLQRHQAWIETELAGLRRVNE